MYILNHILENERLLAIGLLNFLCFNDSLSGFAEGEDVAVICQKVTNEGTPGIEIRSPNKRIFVEVKHDAGLVSLDKL